MLIPETLRGGVLGLLKGLPGSSQWMERNLRCKDVAANIAYVLKTFPDAKWIGGAETIRDAHIKAQAEAVTMVAAKTAPIRKDLNLTFKREPMEHQLRALSLGCGRPTYAYLMEQGTGKTKVVLDEASNLWLQKKIDMLIVVAWPNGVHQNWVDYECPEDVSVSYAADFWTPNWPAKYRQADLEEFLENDPDMLRIFTFNIEAFTSAYGCKYFERLMKSGRVMLVVDQSASIKNHNAQRTKFLLKMSEHALYRRILDGDPCAEGAEELFAQYKFLDHNIIGHDTWTGFKAEFCEIGWFNEIKGYKNLDELHRRTDPYSFRCLSADCQDLPRKIYLQWPFDLSKEEARIYKELSERELATFAEEPVDVEVLGEVGDFHEEGLSFGPGADIMEEHSALVKALRLQQVSSGWWPVNEFKPILMPSGHIHMGARHSAFLSLVASHPGEKMLIFSRFMPDLLALQRSLGDAAVSYHGRVNTADRAEAKRRFMTDPSCLYFLGQPKSAGIGHTLTAAKHVVFYANDPSCRLRVECEKRAHRQGLKHQLRIWDLIAKGTQDIKLTRALRQKKELAQLILRDPHSFFMTYEN